MKSSRSDTKGMRSVRWSGEPVMDGLTGASHERRGRLLPRLDPSTIKGMAKTESYRTGDNPAGEPIGRAAITPLADRKVVFISHANPEDNAITAWYGARL